MWGSVEGNGELNLGGGGGGGGGGLLSGGLVSGILLDLFGDCSRKACRDPGVGGRGWERAGECRRGTQRIKYLQWW